jgi:hypothetical protein
MGVNVMDIIRVSDYSKRLIIRSDSFFGYPQHIRILDSKPDSIVWISDMRWLIFIGFRISYWIFRYFLLQIVV